MKRDVKPKLLKFQIKNNRRTVIRHVEHYNIDLAMQAFCSNYYGGAYYQLQTVYGEIPDFRSYMILLLYDHEDWMIRRMYSNWNYSQ